jgi:hypothetical protein
MAQSTTSHPRHLARESSSETEEWVMRAARLGYFAKGVTYSIIGGLALQAAFGAGGATTGSKGAIATIAQQPYGKLLLGLVAIGLAGYALWRTVQATMDPEGPAHGESGTARRIYYAVSAVVHGGLVVYAARILTRGGGSDGGAEQSASWLMAQPFGRLALGLIGLGILGAAVYQFRRAWDAGFRQRLRIHDLDQRKKDLVVKLSRFGLAARGVVFTIVGGFTVLAAFRARAWEVKDTGGALRQLEQWSGGPWLLGLVAVGLLCYALLQFVTARYRIIEI